MQGGFTANGMFPLAAPTVPDDLIIARGEMSAIAPLTFGCQKRANVLCTTLADYQASILRRHFSFARHNGMLIPLNAGILLFHFLPTPFIN